MARCRLNILHAALQGADQKPADCRELYGRGVISWAKGTSWYQSLQEAQNRAAVAAAASQDNSCGSAKIQVEQLNGQVSRALQSKSIWDIV